MIIYSDTLHWSEISLNCDLVTELDLITVFDVITLFREVSIGHMQQVRQANRGRLLLQASGPVPYGTCICSNIETIHSWTCQVYQPFEFRTSLGTSILLRRLALNILHAKRFHVWNSKFDSCKTIAWYIAKWLCPWPLYILLNKSCQKTTMLAGRQPSLNRSHGLSFSKVRQTSRSRSPGQKLWYHVKGLVTMNTHVQYESPISSSKKVMAKVKVFQSRSNFKVKVTWSKIRSCHKEYICAIWNPYLFW